MATPLPFRQAHDAGTLERRGVHEDILSALIRSDKAEALMAVIGELLYSASGCFDGWASAKAGMCHAGVIDAHDTRIRGDREVEGHGRRHLGDEADVRDGGTFAMAEPAARGMLGKQRLDRLQTSA
jgi:hypothetical protein